jgi:predicted nucleotidyltransferase component of viral defense system
MKPKTYATAAAAKEAIEQRLSSSFASIPRNRSRQLLIFDRFLARVSRCFGDAAVLKGGLALELRLKQARTTKDVDLRLMGSPKDVLANLQRAGRLDLGDYMIFEVKSHARHPDIQNGGLKYDGLRFQATCMLAGKIYGSVFGVDVAFGDPLLGEPDEIVADDVLGFMGVEPPRLRVYPAETHIAEKLHAYTMPRERPNSRVKDLPDLALLARTGTLESLRVRRAIEQTFAFRDTHPVPPAFPAPPEDWRARYEAMARNDSLPWTTLGDVARAVTAFLGPLLAGELTAAWDRESWSWK